MRIDVREYPSQTGTNQGPLLQHEDCLRDHRCKFLCSLLPSYLEANSSLIQAVVKHSRDKDQFLRVSLKRMQETQMYETELKEANEYISALFAWLEELEAKCAEANRLKEGKILLPFCLVILSYPSILWTDHDLFCRV
jgi:hypothetical protein